MIKKENIIDKLAREISENRAKIIDDFGKAYLASRWEDHFSKQKKIDFRRLELVIQQGTIPSEDGKITTTYFFRLRKGKLPKSNQPLNK